MASHKFTRQELYHLVWSEPMIKLAARYGISGNGLAKACRRADIPVPERGYWARKQAGQKVSQQPLPAARSEIPEEILIAPPEKQAEPPAPPPIPTTVQEKIEAERNSGKLVVVPATLKNPHRVVAAWLDDDRRQMRNGRFNSYSWHTPIDKTDLQKRRLRILSALFKALEERGYKLNADR